MKTALGNPITNDFECMPTINTNSLYEPVTFLLSVYMHVLFQMHSSSFNEFLSHVIQFRSMHK